jgi:hypothetical protein
MRVEINIPDDKKFLDKLQKLADAENRSRKNWLETVIVNTVNNVTVKPKQGGSNNA